MAGALASTTEHRITAPAGEVSALFTRSGDANAVYVSAHGAGAGMRHRFMEALSRCLAECNVAVLRYQFPYMEAGRPRTDSPAVATATVQAACDEAARLAPGLPLFAGGKSFGGRMTSHAAALGMLPNVLGIAFVGFPLHPPKRPSRTRADHLDRVTQPMLFLQGTRDDLADLGLLQEVLSGPAGIHASLHIIDGANHSFEVPKRTGRTHDDVIAELAATMAAWFGKVVGG